MSERSVRERVAAVQAELRDGTVQPPRARAMLMTLTSLLGNCNQELASSEAMYTAVLAKALEADEGVARARIRAESSPEYAARQEARNIRELVVELIRSLKVILRSVEEELRAAR
jgi:hypothetical protein